MIVPAEVLSPPTPKSFWTLIADILPSAGSQLAEKKASMDNFYDKVDKSKSAKADSTFDRKEMNRARDAIRDRVDQQGKKSEQKVKDEVN